MNYRKPRAFYNVKKIAKPSAIATFNGITEHSHVKKKKGIKLRVTANLATATACCNKGRI